MSGLKSPRPGFYAWMGMIGFAGFADYWLIRHGDATMSAVWGDAIAHPARRWPLLLGWVILTLHLFGRILPGSLQPLSKYDPIGLLARKIAEAPSG